MVRGAKECAISSKKLPHTKVHPHQSKIKVLLDLILACTFMEFAAWSWAWLLGIVIDVTQVGTPLHGQSMRLRTQVTMVWLEERLSVCERLLSAWWWYCSTPAGSGLCNCVGIVCVFVVDAVVLVALFVTSGGFPVAPFCFSLLRILLHLPHPCSRYYWMDVAVPHRCLSCCLPGDLCTN